MGVEKVLRYVVKQFSGGQLICSSNAEGIIYLEERIAKVWSSCRRSVDRSLLVGEVAHLFSESRAEATLRLEQLREDWREMGIAPCAERCAGQAYPFAAPPEFPDGAAHWLNCRLGQLVVQVNSNIPFYISWLKVVLGDLAIDNEYQCDLPALAVIAHQGKTWVLIQNEQPKLFADLDIANWYTFRSIWRLGHAGKQWLSILHGAAVEFHEKVVILTGASGAGKTSLAAALIEAGGSSVADDMVPIELETESIWPVPLRTSVKPGSWDAHGAIWRNIAAGEPEFINGANIRFVEISPQFRKVRPTNSKPLLIFPLYERNAKLRVITLSSLETLIGLGRTGSMVPNDEIVLEQFVQWTTSTPAFLINYSNNSDALAAIIKLASEC